MCPNKRKFVKIGEKYVKICENQRNTVKCKENQRKMKEKGGLERVERTRMGLGPAEGAVAAYFASRKQNRISESAVSAYCPHTAEPGKGAGRIIEPAERYTASPHMGVSAAESAS